MTLSRSALDGQPGPIPMTLSPERDLLIQRSLGVDRRVVAIVGLLLLLLLATSDWQSCPSVATLWAK